MECLDLRYIISVVYEKCEPQASVYHFFWHSHVHESDRRTLVNPLSIYGSVNWS
jgi:hypothetical protein